MPGRELAKAVACLRRVPEVFFQAGNHRELVEMTDDEWERLARPIVGQLCLHRLAAERRAG